MKLTITSRLSSWIAKRVAAFPQESPEHLRWLAVYVADAGALPLSIGVSETIALCPDGEVVRWSIECEYPGILPVDDQQLWRASLIAAVNQYPELQILLTA